ncbi:glycoside hydrolase family 9 protein [PVC group bacterium]|nr:glycoside hydrolase family 9 protein [PVC group bacterium]
MNMHFITIAVTLLFAVLSGQISPAVEGNKAKPFLIHEPAYDGVDQLLVLSSRWLIIATRDIEEVAAKINELSGGEFQKMIDAWEASKPAGNPPNWTAYKGRWKVRDQYIAEAREFVGERKLSEPDFFTITSKTDSNYKKGKHASRVTKLLISLGDSKVKGWHGIDYAHYSYLEMPEPLKTGHHYTVRVGNGKSVSCLYDEKRTVSRAIKVNQLGYLPNATHKYAYIGCSLFEFGPMDCSDAKTFQVINADTGDIALEGKVTLRAKDPHFAPSRKEKDPAKRGSMYGEDVYEIDLGPLKKQGTFFISVPGIGRSWNFSHSPDVYGEAFYTATRGMYHQRCTTEIKQPYSAWPREDCHHDPVYEYDLIFSPRHVKGPDADRFDIIGGSIDTNRFTENVSGGWHDAADWDRNAAHYANVFDLLEAYEMNPAKFTDGQLNIPESGNGVPDILDEAEWGIRPWLCSMNEQGGTSGMIETWTHPEIDADVDYAFSQRTRWDSLLFAAAAAQYARLVKSFNKQDSCKYADAAVKAYAFGNNPENSLGKTTIRGKEKRGTGKAFTVNWEEKESYHWPYLIHAKLQLYALTLDEEYLDNLESIAGKAQKPLVWRFSPQDYSPWLYADIVTGPASKVLTPEFVEHWKEWYLSPIKDKEYVGRHGSDFRGGQTVLWIDSNPYRATFPRFRDTQIAWGGSDLTNPNRCLLINYIITKDPKYLNAAIVNADFMFGANPMGMSWTTGIGSVYPISIQHAPSEYDGIADPVPGITIYGISSGPVFYKFRENVWSSPQGKEKISFIGEKNKKRPLWRRYMSHPSYNTVRCEFTIHETMASTILTCAALMPEGWMPSEDLMHRQPTPQKQLYGYWYLP